MKSVRCPSCGRDLFGRWMGDNLQVKYKERQIVVWSGLVTFICRYCGQRVTIRIPESFNGGEIDVGVVITLTLESAN